MLDFKIIEGYSESILLYRDLDDDGNICVIHTIWFDDIYQFNEIVTFENVATAQCYIADFSEATGERLLNRATAWHQEQIT